MQVTREPATVAQADVDRLREHGWDDAAIHDAIQTIAYFNYINRVADAVGIEEEPEWRTSLGGTSSGRAEHGGSTTADPRP
jgi:hypothetical protein